MLATLDNARIESCTCGESRDLILPEKSSRPLRQALATQCLADRNDKDLLWCSIDCRSLPLLLLLLTLFKRCQEGPSQTNKRRPSLSRIVRRPAHTDAEHKGRRPRSRHIVLANAAEAVKGAREAVGRLVR